MSELDLDPRTTALVVIDLQRGIVARDVAPHFGVESTARDGWERGFRIVFVEDAMAGLSAEAHAFAVTTIFPRIGRVRSSAEVLAALGGPA